MFEAGDPVGHADPLGAAAAKQARAGRIGDASMVPQPAHGRQRIEAGDYLIINDKIAVMIENRGLSDGYARFGGESLSVDRVGADGEPMGLSLYGETLMGIGIRMIDPTSVTVLHDGSDGGEAVVRVTGPIQPIPLLDGPLRVLFPRDYELQMAHDYAPPSPSRRRPMVSVSRTRRKGGCTRTSRSRARPRSSCLPASTGSSSREATSGSSSTRPSPSPQGKRRRSRRRFRTASTPPG